MNNDLMAWCVYEKYFRFRKEEYTEHDLKNLEIVAQTIISLIEQKDGSAFEFIVFAIVNIYKKKRDIDSYKKIIDWLDRLNIELLDKEVKSFQNNSGRFIEIQSRKEEYYSIKTKSLLSLEKYAECINCCELAEKDIDKFHYDNDIWIGGRKYYSYGKLGDTDIALAGLKELVGKKNHWSLLFEIAQIYSIKKQREDALDYAYRALLTRDQDKMKIKVLYFVAENLERLEEKNLAKAHYCYYKKIREENGWGIPTRLLEYMKKICNYEIEASELQNIWLKKVKDRSNVYEGKVSYIMPNKKNGFIHYQNGSIFFRVNEVFAKCKIKEGTNVSFIIGNSFDIKKNKKTKIAEYVEVI